MRFIHTAIPDVVLVEPDVFSDERGFFMETWHRQKFSRAGIDHEFVQDNHSRSGRAVLRGLHYQLDPYAQGKLVRATIGEVFDVAVDLRRNSLTFGQWVGKYLSDENKRMLWIPPGFAHGFCATSKVAELQYKCTCPYVPEHERCIRWDDPDLGISWPLAVSPLVSARDRQGKAFQDAELFD